MRQAALLLLVCLCLVIPPTVHGGAAAGAGSNAGQARNSSVAERYYQRGLVEARRGQEAAAIADFERSIRLDPDRVDVRDALDDLLFKRRQWAISVQYWTEYIQLHPSDGHAYCQRGAAYSWLHDAAHMQADAEEACSLGDQRCCELVRAHQAAPPPAARQAPLPRFFWSLIAMVVCFPVLLIVYLIWRPKAVGTLDLPKQTRFLSLDIGELDRPASTFFLFLYSTAFTGILLIVLFYIRLIDAEAMLNLLWSATLVVMGVFLFVRGFALYREFRVVLTTAESPILGLAMGFVEVHGKATGVPALHSPVSGTPCFFYRTIMQDENRSTRVETAGSPFYLADATGKVRVEPDGLECDLLPNTQPGIDPGHTLEYCVLPGHWYDLVGTCVENPHPQDAEDRNMIVKGSEESTFLISWRTEKGIKARVRRRAVYCIYVGGAFILLGTAVGLALYNLL